MSDIVREVVYPHPPEMVWRALTEPAALAAWLMPNDFHPEVGHKFQFRVPKPPRGWRGIVDCEVLVVEPPRRLAYTWQGDPKHRPTKVTWTLEPVADGTRLRLEHTGFRGVGGFLLRWMLGSGWGRMLRIILPSVVEQLAAGREPTAGITNTSCR
ncbi:MAG TPA: SRPBCC domain-containing protein [Gemmataceae bacterium]|jgi:uncharacterized protein YndB with AHSA1/START domain